MPVKVQEITPQVTTLNGSEVSYIVNSPTTSPTDQIISKRDEALALAKLTPASGLMGVATSGLLVLTGSGTYTTRQIAAGIGISVSGGHGTNVNPTISIDDSFYTDSDGATITFDYLNGRKHKVTLGGNRTLQYANFPDGGKMEIWLFQDATGSRSGIWPTTTWDGGRSPSLASGVNQGTSIVVTKISSTYYGGVALASL